MVPNSMLHSRRLIYPKTRLIREFLGGMIVDPLPFLMSFGVFGARHGFKRFRSNVGSPRFLRKSVMGRDRIQDLRLGKFSLLSPLRVMVVPWIILRHIRLHECSRYSAPAETCWLAKWHRRRCRFSLATAGSVGGLGRSGSVDGFLHSARLPFRAYCFDVIYGWPRVRLLSGLRSVHEDFFCRSYMDDRTFVTSTPGNLLGSVEAWEDWSLRLVCVSRRPRLSSRLRLGQLRLAAQSVGRRRLLGRISLFWVLPLRRGPPSFVWQGCQSVDAARRAVRLLGSLRLSGSLFLLKARQLIVVGSAGFLRITCRLNFGRVSERPRVFRGRLIVTCALLSTGV